MVVPLSTYLAVGRSLDFFLGADDIRHITVGYDFRLETDLSYFFMPILHGLFGPVARLYYLTSMVLRSLAAASFFLPVTQATGSKTLGAASCIIFAVANAGIESTAWQAVGMFVYPGVAFANISIYFLLKSRQGQPIIHHILAVAFCYLAIFISPNRLYSVAFLGTLDLLWFARRKTGIGKLVWREALLYLPVLYILYRVSPGYSSPGVILTSRLDAGSVMAWFTSYGYLALPFDIVHAFLGVLYDSKGSQAILPVFLGAIAMAVATACLLILRSGDLTAYLLGGWSLVVFLVATSDLTYFSHIDLFTLLLGGILLMALIRAFFSWRHVKPGSADLMLFSAFWAFASIALSWITLGGRAPHVAFLTDHRYMTVPNGGFTLALACLLDLLYGKPVSERKMKLLVVLVLATIIVTNLVADQLYFERIRANRHLTSWEHVYFRK